MVMHMMHRKLSGHMQKKRHEREGGLTGKRKDFIGRERGTKKGKGHGNNLNAYEKGSLRETERG